MEWVQVVIGILEIVAIIILGLFLKNYFPSYMDEKGKNLATKEDIAEITRKTEVVQQEFRENFERFSSDIRFKYDFYYRQYTELYCKLYAIVFCFCDVNSRSDPYGKKTVDTAFSVSAPTAAVAEEKMLLFENASGQKPLRRHYIR